MRSDQLWIGTSWKMNKTRAEAAHWASVVGEHAFPAGIQPFVIPPFTSIATVAERLAGTALRVGAQNMHWAEAGAWTGEISAGMIMDCGASLVELGHSERRTYFGETDETVGLKVGAAVRNGLVPLVCIGETAEQKAAGQADAVLAAQVRAALGGLPAETPDAPILLAYEPVWSIGEGGTPASAAYAAERHAVIAEVVDTELGRSLPCLYGGSVNVTNCCDYVRQPHVDGLFIGRSAWEAEGYLQIISLLEEMS